jgi:hypothetical protein
VCVRERSELSPHPAPLRTSLVSMTMTVAFCSQIICQKLLR